MKIFVSVLLLVAWSANACELSEEYKAARAEVAKAVWYAYSECMSSVSSMYYWKEVAKCETEGRGKNIGGGCQHVAGYSTPKIPDSEFSHCEALKIGPEQAQQYLEEYVKGKNITKCSTSQPSAAGQPKAPLLPAR